MSFTVLAPGKALLCGEYAVLHGAPAICVAVDRTVRVAVSDGSAPTSQGGSRFVDSARAHAAALLRQGLGPITIDSTALYEGELKLGLGSSAAVTVGVVGAAFAAAGRTLTSVEDRRALFDVADAAHAEAQGARGSGIDIAASVWGGTIRFQRRDGVATVEPVSLPDEVELTFAFSGRSASTPQLIARVEALAAQNPGRYDALFGRLFSGAQAFVAAIEHNDSWRLVRAAADYGDTIDELGRAAGVELVTREHAELDRIARRLRGAAKPSGAGGGDLGVAFTVGREATLRLREEAARAGLNVLAIGAPAPGLRLETP